MKSEPPAHQHSSDSALRLVSGMPVEWLRFIPIDGGGYGSPIRARDIHRTISRKATELREVA